MNSEEIDFTDSRKLRIKAEEKLIENQGKNSQQFVEADSQRLLHELQVHQIELEMQNEELLHTYETAEMALKKDTMLYDLAPMGYLTLESDGSIRELNYAAAEMLGERHFSLINSNFKLFISDDSLAVFSDFFSRVFNGNAKESCQLKLRSTDQPWRFVYMEGVVVADEKHCLLSVVDITDLKSKLNR